MGTENKIITKVGPLGRQGLSSGVKPGFLKHRLLSLLLLACIAPFLLIPLLLLIFFSLNLVSFVKQHTKY